jgi:hypothetical protein
MVRHAIGICSTFLLAAALGACAQPAAPTPSPSSSPPPADGTANFDNAATPGPADEGLERIALIRELIHVGTKDASALELITAARMVRGLPVYESRLPVRLVPGRAQKQLVSDIYNSSVDGILKRARSYAGTDRVLGTLILEVEAMPRAKPGGAAYLYSIGAGATDTYELTYEAGKRAVIYIEAQEEGHYLRLGVVDADGRHVCTGDRQLEQAHCTWTPRQTGKFRFQVVNPTKEPLNYLLFTN